MIRMPCVVAARSAVGFPPGTKADTCFGPLRAAFWNAVPNAFERKRLSDTATGPTCPSRLKYA